MIAIARRDHPALPFPDGRSAGVVLWYSIIHTSPAGQARTFAEAARVLRPGGHLLVGFQAGEGTRDVPAAFIRSGRAIRLDRHCYPVDQVAPRIEETGLLDAPTARGQERDDQAALLAKADRPVSRAGNLQ
jgi:SAM-dependent methyltransferase